jgi:hypothetical protein
MSHSKSRDDGKIQEKFKTKGLVPSIHPPYSPDLSSCSCWFFGMAKRKVTDRKFQAVQDILGRLTEI